MFTKKLGANRLFLAGCLAVIALAGLAGKLFLNSAYVPVIIMYHSIGREAALDGYGEKLNVRPEAFARQMKFLDEGGYRVIPLADFVRKIKRGEKIPRKTIAITFDDGLRNNFRHAYPVLKRRNFPATIFVATDFIGKENFLTWDEIALMHTNISIGSHTASHGWLPDLDEAALLEELLGSKAILEKNTDREIEILSYPLGGFNRRVREAAERAGYLGAVATNPGRKYPNDDPYALKRIRISMTSDNLFTFWVETSGYYTFIKEIRDSD
jgi:peptidoglycan/xylan/chitin deacetylase (PgdA/CDA1 family)